MTDRLVLRVLMLEGEAWWEVLESGASLHKEHWSLERVPRKDVRIQV